VLATNPVAPELDDGVLESNPLTAQNVAMNF
jgi:hypothetical protein